jgi:hypothetical protein
MSAAVPKFRERKRCANCRNWKIEQGKTVHACFLDGKKTDKDHVCMAWAKVPIMLSKGTTVSR